MKRFGCLYIVLCFFSLFFFSCSYGWDDFFYREDQVNSRSDSIVRLDGTSFAPSVGSDKCFSVILMTDVHFGKEGGKNPEYILSWVKAKSGFLAAEGFPAKFIICLGDVTSSASLKEYSDYVDLCTGIKGETGLQVYTIPGNHDLYNSGWSYWSTMVYPYFGAYKFTTANEFGAYSWYFLDTANGTLGNEQLEDLSSMMENDPNYKVVLSHYPIYGDGMWYYILQNENERDTLVQLFAKNNVKLVLEGHMHLEKNCHFGAYFEEKVLSAYERTGEISVLKINLETGLYCVERDHI